MFLDKNWKVTFVLKTALRKQGIFPIVNRCKMVENL
ncbi:hypothetical protein BBR47_27860 [Brevibacillus brevis NBRC 100599]|uniref:Uncharacterized protein n=1 Tax=Brevibacillus brevis (strain 47 / JCM 6285 / NBRC 100599) TaxID=358681 RepID=C0ZDA4_BREBN|nr:hypothetical protein BBR47_27860 [Brevibacillus brevis NBRC 100599]